MHKKFLKTLLLATVITSPLLAMHHDEPAETTARVRAVRTDQDDSDSDSDGLLPELRGGHTSVRTTPMLLRYEEAAMTARVRAVRTDEYDSDSDSDGLLPELRGGHTSVRTTPMLLRYEEAAMTARVRAVRNDEDHGGRILTCLRGRCKLGVADVTWYDRMDCTRLRVDLRVEVKGAI